MHEHKAGPNTDLLLLDATEKFLYLIRFANDLDTP